MPTKDRFMVESTLAEAQQVCLQIAWCNDPPDLRDCCEKHRRSICTQRAFTKQHAKGRAVVIIGGVFFGQLLPRERASLFFSHFIKFTILTRTIRFSTMKKRTVCSPPSPSNNHNVTTMALLAAAAVWW